MTISQSWRNSLNHLSDRPHLDSLENFLLALEAYAGKQVACIVLYGSMARGDWSANSDYDVLIGLHGEPDERFIDRLVPFGRLSRDGRVEALPYHLRELERMFCHFNLVVLAALRDGVVLHDDGTWTNYQRRYAHLLESGDLKSLDRGWQWTEAAERLVLDA